MGDSTASSLPLARCIVTCSRQVKEVTVSATPSRPTVVPQRDRRAPPAGAPRHRDRLRAHRGRRAPVAQRLLDEPHREVGQHPGDRQDRRAGEQAGVRLAGVGQPEDQQRPVPQVQRVGHRPERDQRRRGEQPAGPGQPVPGGRVGLAVGGGQDHQDRRADGHQRPRPGELPDAVDERAARHDGGQADVRPAPCEATSARRCRAPARRPARRAATPRRGRSCCSRPWSGRPDERTPQRRTTPPSATVSKLTNVGAQPVCRVAGAARRQTAKTSTRNVM